MNVRVKRDEIAEGLHELRQGENVLAIGYRGEDSRPDPLPVGQHYLLMAARTEVAGKTLVQVAAAEEAVEHLSLNPTCD